MDEEKEHDQKTHKEHHNSKKEENKSDKRHDKERTFTIKEVQLWQGIAALVGIVFIISIFTGGFGGFAVSKEECPACPKYEAPPVAPNPGPAVPPSRVDLDVGDAPTKGKDNAPVTIIEFSDFECPFCEKFYSQTLSQIEREYIDTGKVRLAYKHLPLPFHPQAMPAALATECAQEQGKFWEYHDVIFENQGLLAQNKYKEWAGQLGLNQEKFDQCFDSKKYEERVLKDLAEAESAGIGGTPTFLVNGKIVSGAQPFAAFKTEIDAELNR